MMEPISLVVRHYRHMNQRQFGTADAINWPVTGSLRRLTKRLVVFLTRGRSAPNLVDITWSS
jgi:hypothetical protein